MPKRLIVIPAYNEEASIQHVLLEIKNVAPAVDVVVVNDQSSDSTAQKVRQVSGCALIDLPLRMGYWGALQTGLLYAYYKNYDSVLTMDADGQHLPEYVPVMFEELEKDKIDVVIGKCLERGDVSKKIAWKFLRWLTGLQIKDLTSGFRAYSKKALALLVQAELTVFDNADLATLILLTQEKCSIKEIRVAIAKRRAGKSKLFESPIKIMRYICYSIILSLSKRKLK